MQLEMLVYLSSEVNRQKKPNQYNLPFKKEKLPRLHKGERKSQSAKAKPSRTSKISK